MDIGDRVAQADGAVVVLDAVVAGYTKQDIFDLAGAKSYDRGISYVDAVEDLEADRFGVYASVQGSELYEVRLAVGQDGLDGECDCPFGEEGNFCKHCVAVALVYLYESEHGGQVARRPDLRPYLETLDRDELIALLVEAAETDRGLRRRLEARAGFTHE